MYVELSFLFLIYCFATIALAVSVYALWTLEELRHYYKKQNQRKPNISTNQYNKPNVKSKAKGHWD